MFSGILADILYSDTLQKYISHPVLGGNYKLIG